MTHLLIPLAAGVLALAVHSPALAAESASKPAPSRTARAAQTANRAADKAAEAAEKAARRIPYVAEKLDQRAARRLVARRESLPLDDILKRVAAVHPGDVVDVDFERRLERWVYELKLIEPSGLIRRVEVDASTGAILSDKADS